MNLHLIRTLSRSLSLAAFSLATSTTAQNLIGDSLSVSGITTIGTDGTIWYNDQDVTSIFIGMVPGAGNNGICLSAGDGWTFLSPDGSATFSGNVTIGDYVTTLSPLWKGAGVIGESGYNKVVIGPLVSTYTGATVGAHTSDVNAWADLNIAGTNLIFRTNGETEAARLTSSGNFGIGTSNPTAKLDVVGNAKVSGSLTVGNVPVLTTTGNGAGLTGLNASALTTGTLPTSVLPATVVQTDTTQTLANKTLQSSTLENTWLTGQTQAESMSFGAGVTTVGSDGTFLYNEQNTAIAIGYVPGLWNYGISLYGDGSVFLSPYGIGVFSRNVVIGDPNINVPWALSPSWKGVGIVGESGYNKVIVGSLISTYTGATVGAHTSDVNAWADLNIAGTNLIFRTNGETEAARLTSSGNFGIGTSNPTAKLDVVGNAKVSGSLTVGNVPVLTTTGNGAELTNLNASAVTSGTITAARLPVEAVQLTTAQTLTNKTLTSATLNSATLSGATLTGNTVLGGATASQQVAVDASGNVGIGSAASSAAKLQVAGNIRLGANSSSNELRFYGTTGDGLGTFDHTVIAERLYSGNDHSELLLFHGNDLDTSASYSDRIRIDTPGAIVFQTGGVSRAYNPSSGGNTVLTLNSSGRVLVNTTTDDAIHTVQVAGSMKVKGVLRIPASGDLSMGEFTTGTNPAN